MDGFWRRNDDILLFLDDELMKLEDERLGLGFMFVGLSW